LIAAAVALIPAAWLVVRWSMAGSAVQRADDAQLAVYLTTLAPDDPRTHAAAAVQLEKSFDPDDIARALGELETAAALAPANYAAWLDLGRARERSGDTEGAETALRRALELAPNYSRVRWALGNALLRQGRLDEAFPEIRKAVAGDKTFGTPAVVAAWRIHHVA
jgi:Flp pilus assembly protein TadD